ncbi:MAG: nickel pincer cofactor biosynthesis protein LarC [Planctomycetota bacterium]|nr:MAG: nickel pincer cofactor biosynthesis protein LarC [Planctomycetota bacterium]
MLLAALVDAGAEAEAIENAFRSLDLSGYRTRFEQVRKQGIAARRFVVELGSDTDQPHRHLADILSLLESAHLPEKVREQAGAIFTRLAEAEGRVHGIDPSRVHFHEVGAVDAVLDIVGIVTALHLLDIERVSSSPIPPGSGTVTCEHGVLPVPAPATAELLRGVPLLPAGDEPGELITPTGAAVLTTLAEQFGPMPAMTLERIGYGAGTREGRSRPNVVRVLVGKDQERDGTALQSDEVCVLETNLDDVSPEVLGHCVERLFEAGALDAYTVPIQMKKGRPGVLLAAVCPPEQVATVERVIFAETTTFGIRRHAVRRSKLARRPERVTTPFGTIRVMVAEGAGVRTVSPEYEDCRRAANEHAVPRREVMEAARRSWETGRKESSDDGGASR